MCPYHELFFTLLSLPLCPSVAEMEGRVDSCVTGRPGQSGERPSSGQSVAAWARQRPRGGSPRRRLSVEAVAAEVEAWLWAVLSWKRQAQAEHCQQPDSCTDSSTTQHGGGELSKSPSDTHRERLINYPVASAHRWKRSPLPLMACCSSLAPSFALLLLSKHVSLFFFFCRLLHLQGLQAQSCLRFQLLSVDSLTPLCQFRPPSSLYLHFTPPTLPMATPTTPLFCCAKKLSPHLLFTWQSAFPPKNNSICRRSLKFQTHKVHHTCSWARKSEGLPVNSWRL